MSPEQEDKLLDIFTKMMKEFRIDESLREDRNEYQKQCEKGELSRNDIREIEHERTMREKNGECFNFSLALSKEMEKLHIKHDVVVFNVSSTDGHMVVLYKDQEGRTLVADLYGAAKGMQLPCDKPEHERIDIILSFYLRRSTLEYMQGERYWKAQAFPITFGVKTEYANMSNDEYFK